ncbi:MAG TPA: D-glycero-beta-D-manno-heptose 1-phosphate adenylyltransferase [Deltaproteobacteria bacterium]|nr:D-glycero-beta-D-manno-heptose 1-phosphate adenylyltransferase [Deltaproteobacteria bacterium]
MGKIINNLIELKEILEKERKKGKRIVFGNGCFDILHVGHIRYLKGAKSLGDILVIAVNDDNSVLALGKREKVVIPAMERAEIVASIDGVDYVIVFSEPTVENLLLTLRPDIHAKGTDYTEESVPEKDIVTSYGGKVAIVGDPKNHSSRNIISMIKDMREK